MTASEEIALSLGLFEAFGVELEYMIVSTDPPAAGGLPLAVQPVADRVLRAAAQSSSWVSDHFVTETGIAWSNELAAHVIELKTDIPSTTFDGLSDRFGASVAEINGLLRPMNARLLPSAMHPFMRPASEMVLWPHDNSPIYSTFDRIFSCEGHGWSNLQSVHLNLPFRDDREFALLHAAVRLLLPLLPALSASSPIIEGWATGTLDNRLAVYRTNAARVPSISGRVIPERAFSRAEYERAILGQIYRDLEPHDPEGILRYEWANARGAIARFDRNAIEIRVLDVQECPAADIGICRLIVAVLRELIAERWQPLEAQMEWEVEPLVAVLDACIVDAEAALITSPQYLDALGVPASSRSGKGVPASEIWRHLAQTCGVASDPAVRTILDRGTLSRRILRALGFSARSAQPVRVEPERAAAVYRTLADCLSEGTQYIG